MLFLAGFVNLMVGFGADYGTWKGPGRPMSVTEADSPVGTIDSGRGLR